MGISISMRKRIWWRMKRWLLSVYKSIAWKLIEYSKPDSSVTAQIWRARGARIGLNVHIDPTSYLDEACASLLEIKRDAVVAMGTAFILHDSSVNNVAGGPLKIGRIVVGAGAYIGAYVIILPGVVIGEGSIVGAGSLVNSNVPPGAVVFGRPAKVFCSVQDLVQRFSEGSAIQSDMFAYVPFPSQKEQENLSPEEMKSVAIQFRQWMEDWVTGLTQKHKDD